jgi:hypothetical protein
VRGGLYVEPVLVGGINRPVDVEPRLDPHFCVALRNGSGGGHLDGGIPNRAFHTGLDSKALPDFRFPKHVLGGITVVLTLVPETGYEGHLNVLNRLVVGAALQLKMGFDLAVGLNRRLVRNQIDGRGPNAKSRKKCHGICRGCMEGVEENAPAEKKRGYYCRAFA